MYNKKKYPTAIITGDWHLKEIDANPICRLDSYWEAQWKKVDFISELQRQFECVVLCGGDLFDKWKPSPHLISETIKHIPKNFYTVFGNHDLPQHSLELAYKSGIYTLVIGEHIHLLDKQMNISYDACVQGVNWQQLPKEYSSDRIKILVWHIPTYQGKEPYPGCPDPKAGTLLRKYSNYSLIISSDNHKPFVEEFEGRLLVNPGSMMRMDADQIDHKPRVYLWYAETNTVEPVYLPIEKDIISREHLDLQTDKEKRLDAYISQLQEYWFKEFGEIPAKSGEIYDMDEKRFIGFEEKLERFLKVNKTRKPIMDIIFKSLEV